MKKSILLLLFCLAALLFIPARAADSIAIDQSNFPDIHFRDYVQNNLDTDGDGSLSPQEREAVTEISLDRYFQKVASLEGIAWFPNLQVLKCNYSLLTELNLSGNPQIKTLWCQENHLNTLDLRQLPLLEELFCGSNPLGSLDVSQNTALNTLACYDTGLTSLDISHNPLLGYLQCSVNQISALDVSHNPLLSFLDCTGNLLKALDVHMLPDLKELHCGNNQLTSLNLSQNPLLTDLSCGANRLTQLDVSHNTMLTSILCYSNQLESLDLHQNARLSCLRCNTNPLVSISISNDAPLYQLEADVIPYSISIASDRSFDLSTLPSFDPAKASQWSGGTVSGNILTVKDNASQVSYRYNLSNKKSFQATLEISGFKVSLHSGFLTYTITGISGSFPLPPCPFSPEPYTEFVGWMTADGTKITEPTIEIFEETDLYAIWKELPIPPTEPTEPSTAPSTVPTQPPTEPSQPEPSQKDADYTEWILASILAAGILVVLVISKKTKPADPS